VDEVAAGYRMQAGMTQPDKLLHPLYSVGHTVSPLLPRPTYAPLLTLVSRMRTFSQRVRGER
jgi:hypothetical protein